MDKTAIILEHKWEPFWGTPGKTAVLAKGNYEFPFELLLPGDTAESVEGLNAASITYKLKATMARGKLAYDLHTYKHVRVVRTLESSALEFLHAMSVENIWPNKVEYSIVVPRKAIVFGSSVPLETRFTPLLKGLEIGHVSVKLMEIHDVMVQGAAGAYSTREYRRERSVASWLLPVTREEHWQEMIEDTGQEGWVMKAALDLPRKLGRCLQDVNVHGIKVRHKLKMVVALKNPDGHISEVGASPPRLAGRDVCLLTRSAAAGHPPDHDLHLAQYPPGRGRQPDPSGPGARERRDDQQRHRAPGLRRARAGPAVRRAGGGWPADSGPAVGRCQPCSQPVQLGIRRRSCPERRRSRRSTGGAVVEAAECGASLAAGLARVVHIVAPTGRTKLGEPHVDAAAVAAPQRKLEFRAVDARARRRPRDAAALQGAVVRNGHEDDAGVSAQPRRSRPPTSRLPRRHKHAVDAYI